MEIGRKIRCTEKVVCISQTKTTSTKENSDKENLLVGVSSSIVKIKISILVKLRRVNIMAKVYTSEKKVTSGNLMSTKMEKLRRLLKQVKGSLRVLKYQRK